MFSAINHAAREGAPSAATPVGEVDVFISNAQASTFSHSKLGSDLRLPRTSCAQAVARAPPIDQQVFPGTLADLLLSD